MPSYHDEKYKLIHRIEGLSNGIEEYMAELLESSYDQLLGKLVKLEAKVEQTKSLTLQKKYLNQLRSQIESIMADIYSSLGREIDAKAIELAKSAPEITSGIVNKVFAGSKLESSIRLAVPTLTKERIQAFLESQQIEGLYFNEWLKKLESNAVQRLMKEMQEAFILHERQTDQAALISRVEKALGVSRKSASNIAFNTFQTAYNYGEKVMYEQSNSIKGYRHQSELDRRTSPICRSLDGHYYKKGDERWPPLHWNCRSTLVPVWKDSNAQKWMDEQTRNSRIETKAGITKHRDGTTSPKYKLDVEFVKNKVNYNQWLTDLIHSGNADHVRFVKEILGKTRFDLVASGKLTMESLYYAGKLRTLKELKDLL